MLECAITVCRHSYTQRYSHTQTQSGKVPPVWCTMGGWVGGWVTTASSLWLWVWSRLGQFVFRLPSAEPQRRAVLDSLDCRGREKQRIPGYVVEIWVWIMSWGDGNSDRRGRQIWGDGERQMEGGTWAVARWNHPLMAHYYGPLEKRKTRCQLNPNKLTIYFSTQKHPN